ncbi:venom acid phosphatase [Osmia lignaria lignaria]|uniref:venom acid phosphatase n=1 Tax=Osmia lignaria lignaria TaxID=1437193 RepID=UPI00402BC10F
MISFNDRTLLTCAIIGLTAIICVATVEAELEVVSVLFRHGDRTPDDSNDEKYPNDPYLDYDFYPMGRGQLTNQGKRREYTLGRFLRMKYGRFLKDLYTQETVIGVSSEYDRTKMSLQLVLAGLFPPNREQKWNLMLNWQPIPTNYIRRYEDNLFLPEDCPLYANEYDRVLESPEGRKALSKYSDLMKNLTEWSGKNISTPWDMYYLYHTLMAEYSMDLTLPDWAYTVFPNGDLWNGTVFAYDAASFTPLLRRINGGAYLREVTKTMLNFITGRVENERKMYLYSGHESNVAAVMQSLRVYYPHVPEYSSALILELHKIDNEYYVKILNYLGIPSKIIELQIPGCEKLCPFDKYLELMEDVLPSDDEIICNKGITKDYANYKSNEELDLTKYNLIRTAKAFKLD